MQTKTILDVNSFNNLLHEYTPKSFDGTYYYACCHTEYVRTDEDHTRGYVDTNAVCPYCLDSVTFKGLEGEVTYKKSIYTEKEGSFTKQSNYQNTFNDIDTAKFNTLEELELYVKERLPINLFFAIKEVIRTFGYLPNEEVEKAYTEYAHKYKWNKGLNGSYADNLVKMFIKLDMLCTRYKTINEIPEIQYINKQGLVWDKEAEVKLIEAIKNSLLVAPEYKVPISMSGIEWLANHNLLDTYYAFKISEMDHFMIQASHTLDVMLTAMRNAGTSLTI